MKTHLFIIDLRHTGRYKKLFGKFSFWPCECGCTKHRGFGYMFGLFGISFEYTN